MRLLAGILFSFVVVEAPAYSQTIIDCAFSDSNNSFDKTYKYYANIKSQQVLMLVATSKAGLSQVFDFSSFVNNMSTYQSVSAGDVTDPAKAEFIISRPIGNNTYELGFFDYGSDGSSSGGYLDIICPAAITPVTP